MKGIRSASEPYAKLLAETQRRRFATDWGLSETGATGPTGNRYGDAAGHSCMAVAGVAGTQVITLETGKQRPAGEHAGVREDGAGVVAEEFGLAVAKTSAVVPAKARTHCHRPRVWRRTELQTSVSPSSITWLWVLAFARTTAEVVAPEAASSGCPILAIAATLGRHVSAITMPAHTVPPCAAIF